MGGGKGTSTTTQKPPKEIMDAYRKSLGLAEQAISTPYQQYQGQLVAGMNPTQLQGMANVNAAQGTALPYLQQAAQYTRQAAQGVTPGMINQYMSPYLENVVNATQRNLLESNAQQQAAMKGSAIQAGAFGGDRARFAQAELARQQGLAGGQVISGLYNQGYGQALAASQNQLQNLLNSGAQYGNLGMSAQQSILQGAQAQMAAGAQQQSTEQAQLQSAYDQFLQRQAYPYQQAQFYANIAQGIGAGAGGTTAQTPAQPNTLSQILGAVAAIGSIYPSDERLKENIEPIGKTFDGQNIYKYNFKGDGRKQIGLIAQEVEHKHPDAVKTLGDIKMVDYDAATEKAAHGAHKAFGGASMGGVVHPGMERQNFAQGGFGSIPYADFMKTMSWIPTGELTYRGHSPGSTLPEGYKMSDLEKIAEGDSLSAPDFLDPDTLKAFKAGVGRIKSGATAAYDYMQPEEVDPTGISTVAQAARFDNVWKRGGLVGNGYANGGLPSEDEDATGLAPELIQAESGGDFSAKNPSGALGRGQFTGPRLEDAKAAGVVPPDMTAQDFLSSPDIQKNVERWHAKDIGQFIQDNGLDAYVGQEIKGVPITPTGLQAVAHLGGKRGLEKFLKTGGEYNPHDANGTSLMDYLSMGARAGAQSAPPRGGVVAPVADKAPEEGGSSFLPAFGDKNRSILENILGRKLSPQANNAMLAAGLAMLGGRSPYAGVNIGRGALTGLETYYKGLASERETMKAQAEAASTLATAGKTGTETGTMALGQLRMLQQLYLQGKALAGMRQQAFPSWEQFLQQQGFGGRGWEDIKPTFEPENNAPANAGSDTSATETGEAPASGAEAPANTGAEPATTEGAAGKAPSDLVTSDNTNYNFDNVLPQNNPLLLNLGTPEDQAKAETILQSGKVMDKKGNLVTFRGGDQIAAEAKAVADLNNNFKETQAQIPQVQNTVEKIKQKLKESGSDKLTTIRGEFGGLLVALGFGTEEDMKNATTSDILNKLYKQLSLMSPLQGAASTAGIDKIKQVESGTGSPTLVGEAAREIIGNLSGMTQWQDDMIADWGKFVKKHSNTGISDPMRNEWMRMWNAKLPEYSEKGIANTPVADATQWKPDSSGKIPLERFNKGWSYVMPDGSIGVFTGNPEDKYFKKASQ